MAGETLHGCGGMYARGSTQSITAQVRTARCKIEPAPREAAPRLSCSQSPCLRRKDKLAAARGIEVYNGAQAIRERREMGPPASEDWQNRECEIGCMRARSLMKQLGFANSRKALVVCGNEESR